MVLEEILGLDITAGGEVVLIKDEIAASGAFVLHGLLKKLLVQSEHNVKVAFVALKAPFSHYARVAKKQGLNLMQCREKGSLVFVDLFSDQNTWKYSMSQEAASTHENPLLPLYKLLSKAIRSEDKVGCIMFDDICLLEVIARGSQDDLLDFLHYCRAIPCGNGQPKRCSLVILVHEDVYTEDDDSRSSSMFLTELEHSSTAIVHVEPLSSGQATDVHGQISVCYKLPISSTRDQNQVDVVKKQFRVSENSVAFFMPGERVKV